MGYSMINHDKTIGIHGSSMIIHGISCLESTDFIGFFVAKAFSAEVVEIRGLVQAGTVHHMHLAVASLMRKDRYIDMQFNIN